MPEAQLKRETLTNHLPPAACTDDMLNGLRAIAIQKQTSVSAVVRYAIALFLEDENRKSSEKLDKQENPINGVQA